MEGLNLDNTPEPIKTELTYARNVFNHEKIEARIAEINDLKRQIVEILHSELSSWHGEIDGKDDAAVEIIKLFHPEEQPLTKEQIEGEGWVYDRNMSENVFHVFLFEKGDDQYILRHIFYEDRFTIEWVHDCSGEGFVFKGTISNIHQFRTLMQMLGVK